MASEYVLEFGRLIRRFSPKKGRILTFTIQNSIVNTYLGMCTYLSSEEVKPATEGTGIPCEARPTNLPSTTTLPQSRSTRTITTKFTLILRASKSLVGFQTNAKIDVHN